MAVNAEINWEIECEDKNTPTGAPTIVFCAFSFDIAAGDPGCYRDANGDGYPAIPPWATLSSIVCTGLHVENTDAERPPTDDENTFFELWLAKYLSQHEALAATLEELAVASVEDPADDDNRDHRDN